MRRALLLPSVRTHLLIVGAALFAAGGAAFLFLPELSMRWVLVTAIVVSHIGELMVIGAAFLRWVARRAAGR